MANPKSSKRRGVEPRTRPNLLMARCKPNAAHSPKHTGNNNNNNNSHYNNSNNNNTTPRITRRNYNNRKSTENNEIKAKHKKKSECDGVGLVWIRREGRTVGKGGTIFSSLSDFLLFRVKEITMKNVL